MDRAPCVYLLATSFHGRLYTGVTSNLLQRIAQHRKQMTRGHTSRYDIKRLVWFEMHDMMDAAIRREKTIKRWVRSVQIRADRSGQPDLARSCSGLRIRAIDPKAGGPRVKPGVTTVGMEPSHPSCRA